MGRLLFWVLLGIVAYVAAKRWAGHSLRRPHGHAKPRSETMVSCAACGLNVPQSEALGRDGRWFCSREHLEQAPPNG